MGHIGNGYGSEWHLLYYLGRHRDVLSSSVASLIGDSQVRWLDHPLESAARGPIDAEWKGLDFISSPTIQTNWAAFWPQRGNPPNWDGVGEATVAGRSEWLLVEAKAHVGEVESSCGASERGGLSQIVAALNATKVALGVDPARDWLNGFYQYCNRVTVLDFLLRQGVSARLLFVYFTGDAVPGCTCPRDESEWTATLEERDRAVGLPQDSPIRSRIHSLFLPVMTSARSIKTKGGEG